MRTVEECFWQESMSSCVRSVKRKGKAMVERRVRGGENLSEIKLKPCPFCGGEAYISMVLKPHIDCFHTKKCKMRPDTWLLSSESLKKQIKAWNRRADYETD